MNVRRLLPLLVLAAFATALPARSAQPRISDARIENAPGVSPLDAAARFGTGAEPVWIGWSVPGVADSRELCCWQGRRRGGGCSLASRPDSWGNRSGTVPTGPSPLVVLAEVRSGRPRDLRLVSPECPVDGAGRRVVWLGDTEPAASLALLEPLLDRGGTDGDLADLALLAVAHHAGEGADALLERRAFDSALDREAREQAIFWSGNLRGEAGLRLLERVLDRESDADLRRHAVFVLTLSDATGALERLRRAAAEDSDPEVRGQGLFWLGQSEAPQAGAWIYQRIGAEQDAEVREQGVFALSQLDDGAEWLIRVLREAKDPELARKALFWLGQSEDPRAMAELERILR